MKSENSSSSTSSGIGFFGLLTVAFVVLKLTHFIDWPWLWVLSPLWGGFIAAILFMGIVLIVALIIEGIKDKKEREAHERFVETMTKTGNDGTKPSKFVSKITEAMEIQRKRDHP